MPRVGRREERRGKEGEDKEGAGQPHGLSHPARHLMHPYIALSPRFASENMGRTFETRL